jgi:hypothetical protein
VPDAAFAALALLRCRARLAGVLDAVAEPRRSELAAAVAELEGLDDVRLKQTLAQAIRRDDEALREAVGRVLGAKASRAPRIVRQWVARGVAR